MSWGAMKFARIIVAAVLCLASACAFAQSSTAEQEDAHAIETLRAAGADLSKPHDVDFFLLFKAQSQAEAAAAEIEKLGYRVAAIDSSPDGKEWQLHATRQMVPAVDAMISTTRALDALAKKHGGDYDGWGAVPVH